MAKQKEKKTVEKNKSKSVKKRGTKGETEKKQQQKKVATKKQPKESSKKPTKRVKPVTIIKSNKNTKSTQTDDNIDISTTQRPVLLLQRVIFLNPGGNKYISIGYENSEFQPMITLTSGFSYVNFKLEDWIHCFSCQIKDQVEKWLSGSSEYNQNENTILYSNNHKIVFILMNNLRLIYVEENEPRTRRNDGVILNQNEFEACLTVDSNLLKQMQSQSICLNEYYNMYLFYCSIKNKNELDITEYFNHHCELTKSTMVDEDRMFKEIPILCRDKLDSDLKKYKFPISPTIDSFLNVN